MFSETPIFTAVSLEQSAPFQYSDPEMFNYIDSIAAECIYCGEYADHTHVLAVKVG